MHTRSGWSIALVMAFAFSAAANSAEGSKKEPHAWSGRVGCAKCGFSGCTKCGFSSGSKCSFSKVTKAKTCAVAFQVGRQVYRLKASGKADAKLKEKITGYKKALKGHWTVAGKIVKDDAGQSWIVVDSIKKTAKDKEKDAKKAPRKEGSHKEGSQGG